MEGSGPWGPAGLENRRRGDTRAFESSTFRHAPLAEWFSSGLLNRRRRSDAFAAHSGVQVTVTGRPHEPGDEGSTPFPATSARSVMGRPLRLHRSRAGSSPARATHVNARVAQRKSPGPT